MRSGPGILTRRSGLREEIYELECALVDPEVRQSREKMEGLLHEDFFELGSSGRVYDRQMMLSMIGDEVAASVVMRDFEVRPISEEVVLATYRSIGQSGDEARRSSLWVTDGGLWRIRFHQGTRIPNSWGQVG